MFMPGRPVCLSMSVSLCTPLGSKKKPSSTLEFSFDFSRCTIYCLSFSQPRSVRNIMFDRCMHLSHLHNSRSFHFCFVDRPERCVRSSPSTHHRASIAPCFRDSPRAFRITGLRASFAREALKQHRICNPLKDNPRTSYRPSGGFIGIYIYIYIYMYAYVYVRILGRS